MTAPGRAEVQAGAGAPVLRLRPIVHASPVADGFHVRGARSSFTVSGGPALWRLWQALAEALAEGRSADRLRQVSGQPAVQSAVDVLMARLAEHDMLVGVPAGWGQRGDPADPPDRISRWLEATAADPVVAWRALRAAAPTVRGTGRVATAAARALRAAGLQAAGASLTDAPADGEVGVLQAGETAVAAMAGRDVGFVTPAGPPRAARAGLVAIAARVGLDGAALPPPALAALAGGAAAHRLICAVAGLPDPGTAASSFAPLPVTVPPGLPSVLIARLDPLRAQYHPWLGAASARPAAAPPDMPAALAAVAALGDAELGVMPAVELADLPQLPAGLARCRSADLIVYGAGVNAEMARLAAATAWCAAALRAGLPGGRPVAVGVSRAQADSIMLRRLADRRLRAADGVHPGTAPLDEAQWARSAQARLWWKAVTLRFAVPALMQVTQLADGVFHAAVSHAGQRLGWAVEATPADAAAFAALTAAGALQSRQAGGAHAAAMAPVCGAQPAAAPDPGTAPPWESGDWIWPAGAAARERHLCRALEDLLGGPAITVLEPSAANQAAVDSAAADRAAGNLIRALDAVGFVAVTAAA